MAKLSPKVVARLKNRPYYAFLYAKNILGGRLPDSLEVFFVKDPQSAYLYAKYVVKGRLPDFVHNGLLLASFEEVQSKQYLSMYLTEICGG
jgi:hypothetical protein